MHVSSGSMIESTDYWDSLVCRRLLAHICKVEHMKYGCKDYI